MGSPESSVRFKSARPYAGYLKREQSEEDKEITHVLPGTPLGEYLRQFWQPICLSDQLRDVPLSVRVFGEDLVVFRDQSGAVGLLHKHCCHRGASLEFGIIQEHGIRCCYHGFHFAVDGTLLDAPTEPDRGRRIAKTVCQGAYPAQEYKGLVFAYLGPPDDVPPFEVWDAFEFSDDTELRPFSNVYPCNWLQVLDNISDQMHTATLHQPATLYPAPPPSDLDFSGLTLPSFGTMPVLDYFEVRDATAMAFVAGRRTSDELVWWRINECALPNMSHHAYLFEDGKTRRLFHRVHMVRWYLPVDNENTIIYGWRMFGRNIDPLNKGRKERVGWDNMDFLDGQVGNRPYEVQQRLPGDWEAIVGQRPIAIHALENPTSGDTGVYMFRRLLRNAIRGANPSATPKSFHEPLKAGRRIHTFTQNSILRVPKRLDEDEDRALIRKIGHRLIAIAEAAEAVVEQQREEYVRQEYENLEALIAKGAF